MKKILNLFLLVLVACAFVGCKEKCEHEAGLQWEADETSHYHVCTKCGEKVDVEAHKYPETWTVIVPASVGAEGSEYRQCSVCKKTETRAIPAIVIPTGVAAEDTVVYVKAPVEWTNANVYYWGDAIESTKKVGWPGYALACVDEENNVWGGIVPAGVDNVIFNNGSVQTANLPFGTENNCYELTGAVNAENQLLAEYVNYTQTSDVVVPSYPISEAETFRTIYVKLDASWTTHNIHFWGAGVGTTWPGEELTVVDAENGVYSFELSSKVTGVIFNGDVVEKDDKGKDIMVTKQTANILPNEEINGYVVAADGAFTTNTYENGEFKEITVKVPTVLYVRGSMNGWEPSDEFKLAVDGADASIVVELVADDTFKIGTAVWDIEFNANNVELGECFEASGSDIKVVVAGTYKIVVTNYDEETRACTITVVTE